MHWMELACPYLYWQLYLLSLLNYLSAFPYWSPVQNLGKQTFILFYFTRRCTFLVHFYGFDAVWRFHTVSSGEVLKNKLCFKPRQKTRRSPLFGQLMCKLLHILRPTISNACVIVRCRVNLNDPMVQIRQRQPMMNISRPIFRSRFLCRAASDVFWYYLEFSNALLSNPRRSFLFGCWYTLVSLFAFYFCK